MATQKFYLSSMDATAPAGPASRWNDTGSRGVDALTFAPTGAGETVTRSSSNDFQGWMTLLHRWVSPAITAAGTLESEGLALGFTAAVESPTGGRTAWNVRVIGNDGAVRGTLLDSSGGGDWPTSLTAISPSLPANNGAVSAVAVQPGDRVIIEFGWTPTGPGETTASMRVGGTGNTDLAVGDTGTAARTRPGWVEFTGANSSDLWEGADDGTGSNDGGYRAPDGRQWWMDISRFQAQPDAGYEPLNLATAADAGYAGVTIKIGQGAGVTPGGDSYGETLDPEWTTYRDQALQLWPDTTVGYWYLGNVESPASQASRCAAAIGDRTIPVMLDWEDGGGDWNNLLAVLAAFRAEGLRVTMLYTGHNYGPSNGMTDAASTGLALAKARYWITDVVPPRTVFDDQPSYDWGYTAIGGLTPVAHQFGRNVLPYPSAPPTPVTDFAGSREDLVAMMQGGSTDEAAVLLGWGPPLPASDEFDTPGVLDRGRWAVYGDNDDDSPGCWTNPHGDGLRCSANANVITEGGETFLRINGETSGTSGALASRFDQQYGRWEIRARFTGSGSGRPMNALGIIWPESDLWPEDGEYDFLETTVGADRAEAFIHYPHQVYSGGNAQAFRRHSGGLDLTEWHNWAFEWDENGTRAYVDGVLWYDISGINRGDVPNAWTNSGRAAADFRMAPIQAMPSGHLTIQLDSFARGVQAQVNQYDVEWVRIYPPAERQTGPGAFAGRNRGVDVGETVTLTGTERPGASVSARQWRIVSGPHRIGEVLSTSATLEFTPTLPGGYLLEYSATGAGTSSDRVRVTARPDGTRVNLAINPAAVETVNGPTRWWGGDFVTDLTNMPRETGLYVAPGETAISCRFPVVDSNLHSRGADSMSASIWVRTETDTVITAGVDWRTAFDGGDVIPSGARSGNATRVTCRAGVPTLVKIVDQPRNPDGTVPQAALFVPSNAVSGVVTLSSADGSRFVATALLVERGTGASTNEE